MLYTWTFSFIPKHWFILRGKCLDKTDAIEGAIELLCWWGFYMCKNLFEEIYIIPDSREIEFIETYSTDD